MKDLAVGISILVGLSIFVFVALIWTKGCTTIAERKVYENSYQNSEARRTEIMTMEAELESINEQLSSPSLAEETRNQLEGQRRAINTRLKVARKKYDQVLLKE